MRRLNPIPLSVRARLSTYGRLCLLFLAVLGTQGVTRAQGDTEIFLVRLNQHGDSLSFGTPENLTQNPGYDNQPAFTADGALLFASTRNGQTDLARLDLDSGKKTWLSDTPGGGEYSPLPIPGRQSVSAIRLDSTGLQRLYEYLDGEPSILFSDLKIGYQVWVGPDLLICTVLREDRMDLVKAIPSSQWAETLQEHAGRSLRRIPNSPLVSFTSETDSGMLVNTLDPETGAVMVLTSLPDGVQDLCWLPDGSLLCGGDGILKRFRPDLDADWQVVHQFESGFGSISRLAVNEAGTLLALVVEQNKTP